MDLSDKGKSSESGSVIVSIGIITPDKLLQKIDSEKYLYSAL